MSEILQQLSQYPVSNCAPVAERHDYCGPRHRYLYAKLKEPGWTGEGFAAVHQDHPVCGAGKTRGRVRLRVAWADYRRTNGLLC